MSGDRENILDDPDLAAAALGGFQGNATAVAYAAGYAAGEASARSDAEVRLAAAGTAEGALGGLREWILSRFAGAARRQDLSVVLAEIERRLSDGKDASDAT